VDATNGEATVRATAPEPGDQTTTVQLSAGRFVVSQANAKAAPLVWLRDVGRLARRCRLNAGAATAHASRKKRHHRHGHVHSHGRVHYKDGWGAANPIGGTWTVSEYCRSAVFSVQQAR
jgi:hypothetical protein